MTIRTEAKAYADSYASWALAIAVMRERLVRERRVMPMSEQERIWRERGPVPLREMDMVRCTFS